MAPTPQTLVLVNGRPVAAMVAGTPDLSRSPLDHIERIEYIRGPRPPSMVPMPLVVLSTSSPPGQERQHKPPEGRRGQPWLRPGSASVQCRPGRADRHEPAGFGRERTDGFDVVAGGQQPDRDGFDSLNGQFGLNHAFNDAWSAVSTPRAPTLPDRQMDDPYAVGSSRVPRTRATMAVSRYQTAP